MQCDARERAINFFFLGKQIVLRLLDGRKKFMGYSRVDWYGTQVDSNALQRF